MYSHPHSWWFTKSNDGTLDKFLTILCPRGKGLICGCLTLLVATGGCQGLSNSSLIPGMGESRRERQIVQQAENDPFPSPSDVGIRSPE